LYEFALRFCDEKINQYYFHDSDTLIHGEIENLVRNSMKEEQMTEIYNKACHDLEDDDQIFELEILASSAFSDHAQLLVRIFHLQLT